jgi:S-adenosylmethionine:tRNA ribosyltransferase-isomerase
MRRRLRESDRNIIGFLKDSIPEVRNAFVGRELILAAYNEAVMEKYRFFSYGDCMLIL